MKRKLKPCPFCGCKDAEVDKVQGEAYAYCPICGVTTQRIDIAYRRKRDAERAMRNHKRLGIKASGPHRVEVKI